MDIRKEKREENMVNKSTGKKEPDVQGKTAEWRDEGQEWTARLLEVRSAHLP